MAIKFGTSGFRGIIGDNWTKENVQKIGYAFRQMVEGELKNVGKSVRIVVGFDNRFMGRESAQWLVEAMSCDLINITFMDKSVPTNVIVFKAVSQFDYGIMITASHNPYQYNGIKVFLPGGKDADDGFFDRLSRHISDLKRMGSTPFAKLVESHAVVLSNHIEDYIEKVLSSINVEKIKNSKIKVLFNPMHGSGREVVETIFDRLEIKYDTMNGKPDPMFGGGMPAPYKHLLKEQSKRIVKDKFSVGFALDGDGDRVAFLDSNGEFYDCNYLLAVLYYYLTEYKKQSGGVVRSFLSSNLTGQLCEKYGQEMYETKVGFKYLAQTLEDTDAILAGESTGIAFKEMALSKDGIFTAFQMIDALVAMKKNIGKIIEEVTDIVNFPTYYIEGAYSFDEAERDSVKKRILNEDNLEKISKTKSIEKHSDGIKIHFADGYWAAARMSGTEPVVRLYTEMQNQEKAEEITKKLEKSYGLKKQ